MSLTCEIEKNMKELIEKGIFKHLRRVIGTYLLDRSINMGGG